MGMKVIRKKVQMGTDEFVTSRSRVFKYLSDNFNIVVIASSIIGVLLVSYIGFLAYSRQKEQRAADALSAAMKVYQAKVDPAGTGTDTFKTADEKYRATIAKFSEIAKNNKGSRVEEIALLYTANAYYSLKEFDKALEFYNKILFKIDREDPSLHGNINEIKASPGIVRDSALYGLASSFEQKGDFKKAIELQASLTSSKNSHLKEMGLAALGRLYEKGNDKAKALETYQKIITEFPESSNLSSIKEKVERLKG